MRTDEQIVAEINLINDEALFFDHRPGDLISYLPFEVAKPFLKEGVTAEQFGAPRPRDADSIKAEIADYMDFAWSKANGCRGLSAGRSIQHMSVWLWMLGEDAAAETILDYSKYGKPQLRAICEKFGIDWTKFDDGEWRDSESDEGQPAPQSTVKLEWAT